MTGRRRTFVVTLVFWTLIAGGPAAFRDGAVSAVFAQATEDTPGDEPRRPPPANASRVTEKQIKAYSGLLAIVGILIAGLALAALTILWAGRLRRQLRKPLPGYEPAGRDFWFLKPPKPTVTESQLPDWHQPPHEEPPAQN